MTGNGAGDAASDLFGLAGQVAVVTGGSRGIGRAIAAGFAEAGADVVIASRKLGNCVAAAAEISASTGRTAVGVEFHAGRWADCDRLIEVVYREFGRCDVLVNNAGMSPLYEDLASVTEEYYGTAEQKERFLVPLVNGERRICFSMTERAAGSDATGMRTTAVRDGENWILNGEKWFSSSASISDYALVMARTDADAPRHRQFTTFLAELPDPGYQIIRDIPTLHEAVGTSPGGHAEVRIRDLRVPHANVIGEVGGGFAMGQHRLGYGRLRHGMWSIAKAQRALDMAAAHALERETFGQILADRQGVQWMLADCARDLYIARLMVLHIAYKMENGLDISQENSIAKNFIADMLSSVVDTALQIHGALGYTLDTPLAAWYAEVRMQHLVDGPDEVHRWRIGRNVLAAQRTSGTTAAAAGGDLF